MQLFVIRVSCTETTYRYFIRNWCGKQLYLFKLIYYNPTAPTDIITIVYIHQSWIFAYSILFYTALQRVFHSVLIYCSLIQRIECSLQNVSLVECLEIEFRTHIMWLNRKFYTTARVYSFVILWEKWFDLLIIYNSLLTW